MADRLIGGLDEQRTVFQPAPSRPLRDRDRLRITPRHFAFLKISEGCDRLCTFCAIPKMRGKHATKPIEEVVAEARELAADGVRELVIVAQDTTYYGKDLYGEPRLVELLRQLEQVEGHRVDPADVPVSDVLRRRPDRPDRRQQARSSPISICRCSTSTTRCCAACSAACRGPTPRSLLAKLREADPGPGAADDVHHRLSRRDRRAVRRSWSILPRQQRFERLGVFTYSFEPDTPAARLPDHLAEEMKEARRERLMAVQQQIAFDWNEAQIGRRVDVLLDRPVPGEKQAWIGRSHADAPDVDSVVYVTGQETGGRADRAV